MNTDRTERFTEGLDPYKNPGFTASATPRYAEFLPWAADSSFLAGPPYFSDSLYSNPASNIPQWPATTEPSRPLSLVVPAGMLPGGNMGSPDSWSADSESYDKELFSPVASLGSFDWDSSPVVKKRSWSEASSPRMDDLPSPALASPTDCGPLPRTRFKTARMAANNDATTTSSSSTTNANANTTKATTRPKSKPAAKSKPVGKPAKSRKVANATPPSPVTRSSTEAESSPKTADEECRARRNHNLVEKQYRNRLNAQFERLLAILPEEEHQEFGREGQQADGKTRPLRSISSTKGKGSSVVCGPDDRRISKAEVLEMATTRIRELEAERKRLQHERRELLRSIELATGRRGLVVLASSDSFS